MIDKEKASMNMKKQWTKFGIAFFFYVLFIIWVSPRTITGWILTLLGALFIFDCYVSKKVRWQWWKEAEGPVRFIMSWVDALVFALVAVYFINLFLFQNYVIPSSSLEKSLLTGDYLFVSKVSYGPRIPGDAADDAAYTAYAADYPHKELYLMASLGLSPHERSRTCETQRHRRVQLSLW